MIPAGQRQRPVALAILLIACGTVGWWAAFSLTVEKLSALENPGRVAGCDFSRLVQCSANLESWQGSVLGFPNPLIGVAAWVAPVVIGVALLAGARFPRWMWVAFWLGFVAAMAFVVWLIGQSIFVLGTLCPWCMVTWSVTIPSFLAVTSYVLAEKVLPLGPGAARAGRVAWHWLPLMTVVVFVTVAVLAQLRLDLLDNL